MMKRLVVPVIALLTLLLISEKAGAQRILGGLSVGMNLTQVDGDDLYGFHKFGLNVGPMVAIPFGKKSNWSVSMELLYSQKGSRHHSSTDTLNYTLVQDYAEIPVLIHFTDKKIISGGVGFSYGQLINYKETHSAFFDSLYKPQTSLSNNDISVIADLQIRLWYRLWADVRYQYSMKSNRTVIVTDPNNPNYPDTRKQYNNVISIRLTWMFNQEANTKRKFKQEDE
jgi:hypothetical protein